MDALDQACAHWQEQIESLSQTRQALPKQPTSCWQRWVNRWQRWVRSVFSFGSPQGAVTNSTSLTEILVSHHEGVDLIRRSLLDVLRQRQVIPIEAEGHPFDPQTMYAVGRREMPALRENIVVQEVVRGYLWKGQVLREAQVIVATHTG
jgi:molecular chaperone GrpE